MAASRMALNHANSNDRDGTSSLITIDFLLSYLIGRSAITRRDPERRLNAIENLMSLQAQRWRPLAPIAPERDILMAEVTRDSLVEWVLAGARVQDAVGRRFDAYMSTTVICGTVRPGWIRLLVAKLGNDQLVKRRGLT